MKRHNVSVRQLPADAFIPSAVPTEADAPLESLANVKVAGEPIFWVSTAKKAVFVSARFSTPLKVVDAPRLFRTKREVTVGTLTSEAMRAVTPRKLFELLVHSGALRIYWHISGVACIHNEDPTKDGYRAEVRGQHVYHTNQRNQDSFRIRLSIKANGAVVVSGK